MKWISPAERAVAKKDFGEFWENKMTRTTLLLVPALMVLIIPMVFLVLVYTLPPSQLHGMDQVTKFFPVEAKIFNEKQILFYMMTNMICPMFFLMIPLMSSTVSAACSFVGEKERSTLETLLLTPLSIRRIFKSKVLGCVFLSVVTTAVSFVTFSIVISIGDILLGMPFFLNWNWLILVFLLSPGCTMFGVVFMVLVSGKSNNYTESIQTSGYVVMPVILLFLGQMTGLFQLGPVLLLLFFLLVAAADAVLWVAASRSFTPEKLMK